MRILLCLSSAPLPPTNGFRLLFDALLAELRQRHDVRVVALLRPDQRFPTAPDPDTVLVPVGPVGQARKATATIRAAARGRPVRADHITGLVATPMLAELRRFQPDVVHVASGRLAALGRLLDRRPSLLSAVDARHVNVEARMLAASGVRRLALRDEVRRVRRFESTEYTRFGHTVVVTPEDRAALLAEVPGLDVSVIPNGVDVRRFAPRPDVEPDPNRLVFTGTMSYAPNIATAVHLATRVLPLVRRTHPDATLAIVGRQPAPAVVALDRLDGVTVTGEVPDVRPWLLGSRAFACPMRTGTGIKNKLLEAMACGLPSVTTPLALQGLDVTDGAETLVGHDDAAVAAHLGALLDDAGLARAVGGRARAHIVRHHSWAAVADAYEERYGRVRAGQPAASVVGR